MQRLLAMAIAAACTIALNQGASAQSWTGFYFGVNLGKSFGNSDTSYSVADQTTGASRAASSDNASMNGLIGGGQMGYTWQFSNWVLGFETDFQGSSQKATSVGLCGPANSGGVVSLAALSSACLPGHVGDTRPFDTPAGTITSVLSQRLEWFGTVRSRVGILMTPSILAYFTGGLAYGRVESALTVNGTNISGPQGTNTVILTPVSAAFSGSQTNIGFAVGGGGEFNLPGNWMGRFEYLYIDLGDVSGSVLTPLVSVSGAFLTSSFNSHITDHIVRVAFSYRLGALPP